MTALYRAGECDVKQDLLKFRYYFDLSDIKSAYHSRHKSISSLDICAILGCDIIT
jgi:hypothetical protein